MDSKTEVILEQYKMFVEMTDRVSERRLKTNQFYVGLSSVILAFLAFAFEDLDIGKDQNQLDTVLMAMGALGLIINIIWFVNIRSYRNLNSGKFDVIHEMEKQLPFNPYDLEWDFIKRKRKKSFYIQLSIVEQYLPVALAIPYLLLLLWN